MNRSNSNSDNQSRAGKNATQGTDGGVTNKSRTNQALTLPVEQENEPDSFKYNAMGLAVQSALAGGKQSDSCNAEKSSKTTQAKAKPVAEINPLSELISPIPPGLTIVCVSDATYLPHAKSAFTNLALKKSRELGLPMPDAKVVFSVDSGNQRQLEEAQLFASANFSGKTSVPHESKTCPAPQKIDWLSNEGLQFLLQFIKGDKRLVILDLTIVGPISAAVLQGFLWIRNAAQQADVFVMLIVACSGGTQKYSLSNVCDELIEVHPCEPDVGVDLAFSIDCVGIRNLNSLGVGKTMCSVKLVNGVFRHRYARYISAEHETRIMWALRGNGNTLEEIGVLLKVHKSTILRRLQGLPRPSNLVMGEDWLSRNLG